MLQTWRKILKHGSLFSGIGGFDLAARWNGWQNIFQVEIDDYCNKVLEKNFPEVQRFRDIKEFDAKQFANRIDVLSGGFPCQPFSVAGARRGSNDERYLWHEMLRVIREAKPRWVVAENVRGLLTIENGMVFEQVWTDLNKGMEGYKILISTGKNPKTGKQLEPIRFSLLSPEKYFIDENKILMIEINGIGSRCKILDTALNITEEF
jgi:site-specific DNA-cytosine methylase